MGFEIRNWYWRIAGRSEVLSSARGLFVPVSDPDYQGWLALGHVVPEVASEDEVLAYLAERAPDVVVQSPAGLVAYANAQQWAKATGGFMMTVNGKQVMFATTSESLALMTGKAARLQQPNPPAQVTWQIGPSTFITIAAADFILLATAVADFMQSTFDKLAVVLAGIAGGTITTRDQVDAAIA
ncbi:MULTISPECIES: hypothetical protein [unclassified Bradyrhizobium]|uniref:DUF4376 domain-containing protein n=1 Tax=unclassified Bradyrhizobium TaxID=2631580 RepID=UPI002915D56C|nr:MULTISPECIES: hypothetical protein [unclassified Bradyrhizobium]